MFGRISSLVFLILFVSGSVAQNVQIDSLKDVLGNVRETQQLEVLNKLSAEYLKVDPDSALRYADLGVELATGSGQTLISLQL